MNGMRVLVGPHRYTVTSTELADVSLDACDEIGRCTPHLCEILVHSQATLSMQRDALVHEVLHAIWYQSGLSAAELNEELTVLTLATPLLDVLQQNPAFVDFLTA